MGIYTLFAGNASPESKDAGCPEQKINDFFACNIAFFIFLCYILRIAPVIGQESGRKKGVELNC